MATIKTSDGDVQLFESGDIYRFDVDNRPLRNLIANDQAVNTELVSTTAEVVQSRTGLSQTYASLDARLDDLELAAGYPQKQVAFNEFLARAAAWQARYASGALRPVMEVVKISDIWASYPTVNAQSIPYNGDSGYPGFGQILLRDESTANGTNRVFLGTGLSPRFNTGTGAYDFLVNRPVYFSVAGMLVALFNEAGGAAGTGPTNGVCWNLPAAPSSGGQVALLWVEVWLENISRTSPSFYPYGAVGSLAVPITSFDNSYTLVNNVGFHGGNNGDYFQVRHRLRVTVGINPDVDPWGLSNNTLVMAQGANGSIPGSPTANNVFVNQGKVGTGFTGNGDPALWRAGAGDAGAKAELGTIDGYVYAIPVALVNRRNTGQWTLTNQNGSKTSGGTGSWATPNSGRPDGYYHDKVEKEDVVLIAPSCVSERTNLRRILEESFDKMLRGELRSTHGYLDYTRYYEEKNQSGAEPVTGAELMAVNALAAASQGHTDQFLEASYTPPTNAIPDDFRRVFSPQDETQPSGFTIDVAGNSGSPVNLVSYGTNVITIKAIGQSVGQATALISVAPVMWWSGSKKPVALSVAWAGLGTGTITATVNVADGNYSGSGTIVGLVQIGFQSINTGFKKPNNATVQQTYIDPVAAQTDAFSISKAGTDKLLSPVGVVFDSSYIYLLDKGAQKVYKILRSNYSVTASFGVYNSAAADNTHLNQPSAIALDGSGNVYIADTVNHRVVKLDSSLVYDSQFGVTGVSGNDNAHLNAPEGVAVDGSGNVYISDSWNYRVLKVSGAFSYISTYGQGASHNDGASVPDNVHCVWPRHLVYGDDSNLYVTDVYRIIILNPSTMASIGFIENGYAPPVARSNSLLAVSPKGSSYGIREDTLGNKYVAHAGDGPFPNGKNGAVITKYNSSWEFVARYGCAWDTTGIFGGNEAGTNRGLYTVNCFVLDQPNDAMYVFANCTPAESTTGQYQNVVWAIKMSDLTYITSRWSNFTGGSIYAYGPYYGPRLYYNDASISYNPMARYGLQWPALHIHNVELDPTNHYLYLQYGDYVDVNYNQSGWCRIEKWSIPSTDPATWTHVNAWGDQDVVWTGSGYAYRAWRTQTHDNTRFLNPTPFNTGMSLARDGSALFISDNNTIAKFNVSGTGITLVGRFGATTAPGNGPGNLSNVVWSNSQVHMGGVVAFVASESDINGRLYVTDHGNQRIVILRNTFNTLGSPTAYVGQYTNVELRNFPNIVNGQSNALTTGAARIWVRGSSGDWWELNIAGSNRDVPVQTDLNASTFATIYVPLAMKPLPNGVPGYSYFGISKIVGGLFWTDFNTNQLVAVQTPDYQFLGECGTPGTGGRDRGTWSRPAGIAVDASTNAMFICDMGNGRLLITHTHSAFVEPEVGRVEFLLAPEQSSKWFGYSKFTPYQGVQGKAKPFKSYDGSLSTRYGRIQGRNVLVAPDRMLVTTLGKGSTEGLSDLGIDIYANCVARLPVPISAGDETAVIPFEFSLLGGILTPKAHYFLPILNVLSATRGNYPGQNESYWKRNTLLSFVDTASSSVSVRGGLSSQEFIAAPPGLQPPTAGTGPLHQTFGCSNPPSYRYVAVPFLVVIEGEILLAVRTMAYTAGNPANELGLAAAEVVDLYRPAGHPMLPDSGEGDILTTVI